MIFNRHLDRLMEVQIVQDFMRHHNMQGKLCAKGDNYSFILYRLPYVVEFHDALNENYLAMELSDIDSGYLLREGDLIWCSVSLGHQKREELKNMSFENHQQKEIFLTDGVQKMYGLHTCIEAIDKLLPMIEAKGGLSSMHDGTFDSRFDFTGAVQDMYLGLKEKYLQCTDDAC